MAWLRGAIHWATFDKRRPAIIVSPDYRNAYAHDVILVPCTSAIRGLPTHVSLRKGEGGLPTGSTAQCESILTMHKDLIAKTAMGAILTRERMYEIERAILRAIGIAIE